MSTRRKIFRWLKVIIIIYCGVGIALYYLQDKIWLHPKKIDQDYIFKFDTPFKEVSIPFSKTDTINLIRFFPADSFRKGVVIYFHGSKENVAYYAKNAKPFLENGYEVWMPDYPGFGKSSGEFSVIKLYEPAYQIKKMAESQYRPEQIILYGQSFGCLLAADASTTKIKRLILECPYPSVSKLLDKYTFVYPWKLMSTNKFDLFRSVWKSDDNFPLTVIYGDNGELKCNAFSKEVNNTLNTLSNYKKDFHEIKKNAEENLIESKEYKNLIDSLLK